jgi:hypothetical protein
MKMYNFIKLENYSNYKTIRIKSIIINFNGNKNGFIEFGLSGAQKQGVPEDLKN